MKIFDIYIEIKSKYLTLLEEETCGLTRTITVVRTNTKQNHFITVTLCSSVPIILYEILTKSVLDIKKDYVKM
jgi:hypothetical protein